MCTACVATICTRNYTATLNVIAIISYSFCLPSALRDHHADASATATATAGWKWRRAGPRSRAGRRRSGKVGEHRPERRRRARGGGASKGARTGERADRSGWRWPRQRGGGSCKGRRRCCRLLPRLGGSRTAFGLGAARRIGTEIHANRSTCAVPTSETQT